MLVSALNTTRAYLKYYANLFCAIIVKLATICDVPEHLLISLERPLYGILDI